MYSRFIAPVARNITFKTFGLVVFLAILAKLAGFGKEIAIAARFGVSPKIDGYLFALNFLTTPTTIWLAAASAIFIPQFVERTSSNPDDARQLRKEFFLISLIAGFVVGGMFAALLYIYIATGLSGLSAQSQGHALVAVLWLWPVIPLLFVAYSGAVCLMARNIQINTFYDALPAIFILAALVYLPIELKTLLIATTVGFAAQAIATVVSLWHANELELPSRVVRKHSWSLLFPALMAMLGIQTLQSGVALVDLLLAAHLPTGSVSRFGYALRMQAVFLTILTLAVQRVLLPALSSIQRQDRHRNATFIRNWALLLTVFSTIIAAVGMIASEDIIRLALKRGSFSGEDTVVVADLFAILIWQLPFYVLSVLYSQFQIVEKNYRLLAIIAVIALVTKAFLGILFIELLGLRGLAASVVAVSAIQLGILIYGTRNLRQRGPNPLGKAKDL